MQDVKIREFYEFIPMARHESESFAFVSIEALVMDIEVMYAEQIQKGKRTVVFIT